MTSVASLDLSHLDGVIGFRINGIDAYDQSGRSVAAAGDINGDGIGDLIIGAPYAGTDNAGASYVVFGSGTSFGSSLDLSALDGSNGFRLDGIEAGDQSGISVAGAGDVNGDGIDDLIVGARGADPDGQYDAGESFVVFGTDAGFAASLDLSTLDGTNGFRLDGIDAGDQSGISVAGAGDVNGDGIGDLIIGAYRADAEGNYDVGESYVVFGSSGGFSASLDLCGARWVERLPPRRDRCLRQQRPFGRKRGRRKRRRHRRPDRRGLSCRPWWQRRCR